MQKRHDDMLTTRLELAYDVGVAHICWCELYRWYDTQKIAAGTWRDLAQRWDEITEGEQGALQYVESNSGIFLMGKDTIKAVLEPKEGDK